MQLEYIPTESQVREVERVGHGRQAAQLAKTRWTADPVRQRYESHRDGYGAEFFWAEFLGVEPRPNIGHWDGGTDLIVMGQRVSVKMCQLRYEPGYLKIPVRPNYDWPLRAPYLALARVDWPHRVVIAGWIGAEDFILQHEVRAFSDAWGLSRCMSHEVLEKPYRLELELWKKGLN